MISLENNLKGPKVLHHSHEESETITESIMLK